MAVPPVAAATMTAARPAIRNAEHPLHAANGPANTGADGTPDHTADRTSRPIAFAGALMTAALHTADDALCVRQMGNGEQSQRCRRCCEA